MPVCDKVFILQGIIILFLPNIVSSSVPEFSINMNKTIDATNSGNTTDGCHPNISQSDLKAVLELMNSRKTNVIDVHIWFESVNTTMNKTWVHVLHLSGIKLANEIGRTLISLIAQAEKSDQIMLPSYTSTMTAGVYGVNIVVAEETTQCFFSNDTAKHHAIVFHLGHQLYHISGNKTDYMLCGRPDDKYLAPTEYICCTIVGQDDSSICSYYSSIVTKMFSNLVLVTVIFVFCIVFPVIVEYLSQSKENDTHYRISNSPMSLSSILYSVFIEGHGPVKSPGRKLMFALFVLVTTLPEQGGLLWAYMIFMCPWSLIFLLTDVVNFNQKDLIFSLKNTIAIIALPFNIKLWWRRVSTKWPRFCGTLKSTVNSSIQQSETNIESPITRAQENLEERPPCLPQHEDNSQEDDRQLSFIERMKYRFFILFWLVSYLIAIPFLCLYTLPRLLIVYNVKFVTKQVLGSPKDNMIVYISRFFFVNVTCIVMVFSTISLFLLAFYFIIGLFLNGEIYSPYILPICTIIFYSWTKWRSSVETKYLVLLTSIYKVCKKSVESDECSNNVNENVSIASNNSRSSRKRFIIELDDDGEPIIPKELYNLVRERFLPYDRILLTYFQGVFFIAVFAYLLYIMLSLAQTSGISSAVRIIGTIAATSLPFIFDFVWKKNSEEQNAANSIALKSKLKRILLARSLDDTTGQIVVEFIANN